MPHWERWPSNRVQLTDLTYPVLPWDLIGTSPRILTLERKPVLMIRRERPQGVRYDMQPGCWRDFAEQLNPPELAKAPASELLARVRMPLQRFVRDFGPPILIDQDQQPFDETGWYMSRDFMSLARLWAPPDQDGLSQWQGATSAKVETEASGVIHWFHTCLAHPKGARPGSLQHFMLTEALRFTSAKLTMRLCACCNHWFTPARVDQVFCGPNCRKRAYRLREG
jgi:hypothetical protein